MFIWAIALMFTVTVRSNIKWRHWRQLKGSKRAGSDFVSCMLVKCRPERQEVDAERRCVRKMCLCNSCAPVPEQKQLVLSKYATSDNELVFKNHFLTQWFCCLKSNIYLKNNNIYLTRWCTGQIFAHCWTMSAIHSDFLCVSVYFVKHHVRY